MDIQAKVTVQCDNCKQAISIKKDKKSAPKEDKDELVETIEAELNMPNGDVKKFHLCSEECMRQLLNERRKKNTKASLEIIVANNPFNYSY